MKLTIPTPKSLLHYGLLLMILKVSFSASAILPYGETLDALLSYGSAGILVLYILAKRYPPKTLFLYAVIALTALYSTLLTKQYGFLITVITCFALRDEDFNHIVRFIFSWEALFFVLHLVYCLFYCLITESAPFAVYYRKLRFHFGFDHPNMVSVYLFNLILMWIWLNYSRFRRKHYLVLFAFALALLALTRTRTSFLNTVLLLLFILWQKKRPHSRILKHTAAFLFPLLSLVEYLAVRLYTSGNSLLLMLDRLLTARVRLGAYGYSHYGLTLLGQDMSNISVEWDSFWRLGDAFTFDSTYTYLLINQGLIWLLLIAVSFYLLAKRGTDKVWIMIITWNLYAVTEVHGLNGFMCFPILLVSLLFHTQRKTPAGTARAVRSSPGV